MVPGFKRHGLTLASTVPGAPATAGVSVSPQERDGSRQLCDG
jgi:hypothetical protein